MPACAVIFGGDQQVIDFQRPVTATWAAELHQTPRGLEKRKPSPLLARLWVMGEPFHVGDDARGPFTSLSGTVRVSVEGFQGPRNKSSLQAFIRYSTTGTTWSGWKPLSVEADSSDEVKFRFDVAVPEANQVQYNAAFQRWAYPTRYTGANHDEFYAWLLENEPAVLEKEIPRIRFLQVRLEDPSSRGDAVIRRVETHMTWVVSGLRQ